MSSDGGILLCFSEKVFIYLVDNEIFTTFVVENFIGEIEPTVYRSILEMQH